MDSSVLTFPGPAALWNPRRVCTVTITVEVFANSVLENPRFTVTFEYSNSGSTVNQDYFFDMRLTFCWYGCTPLASFRVSIQSELMFYSNTVPQL